MSITTEQLQEWRHLAENTQMISALGEYTPEEFIWLLDYAEQLRSAAQQAREALLHSKQMYFDKLSDMWESGDIEFDDSCGLDWEWFIDRVENSHEPIFREETPAEIQSDPDWDGEKWDGPFVPDEPIITKYRALLDALAALDAVLVLV